MPSKVVDISKNHIVDALATVIAGCDLFYPSVALEVIRGITGKATIFTYSLRVPAMDIDAGFVNAVLIRQYRAR